MPTKPSDWTCLINLVCFSPPNATSCAGSCCRWPSLTFSHQNDPQMGKVRRQLQDWPVVSHVIQWNEQIEINHGNELMPVFLLLTLFLYLNIFKIYIFRIFNFFIGNIIGKYNCIQITATFAKFLYFPQSAKSSWVYSNANMQDIFPNPRLNQIRIMGLTVH